MQKTKQPHEYQIVVIPDDDGYYNVITQAFNDPELPTIDHEALLSMLFSFINDVLLGQMEPETVYDWFIYESIPVVEESEKIIQSDKMSMLRDLIREFIITWINKLKEEGIIKNEYFAYDFKGLLRDGSFVFRRQEGVY